MGIIKPPVLPAWADAGDKTQPTNTEIDAGWPASATPPSRQRFNWILNFCANAVRYFSRFGIAEYDATETYPLNGKCLGADGNVYNSLQANNINNTPTTSPLFWARWGMKASELKQYAFRITKSIAQSGTASTNVKMTFQNVLFDDDVVFETANNRVVIPTGGDGIWQFGASLDFTAGTEHTKTMLFKNGAMYCAARQNKGAGGHNVLMVTTVQAVAGDIFEVYGFTANTSNISNGGVTDNWFEGRRLISF